MGRPEKQGLLSQYIEARMSQQIAKEFLSSMLHSDFNAKNKN
jgi:hypothetical protein